MVWLGLISYGVFLWHYVFTLHTGWLPGAGTSFPLLLLFTLGCSIPCAALGYYLVERPLLRLKYHRLSDLLRRAS
jgi:peptidoglycan/LPS O-acetylase OafA/YrhL